MTSAMGKWSSRGCRRPVSVISLTQTDEGVELFHRDPTRSTARHVSRAHEAGQVLEQITVFVPAR
jgi:hypothetical protein